MLEDGNIKNVWNWIKDSTTATEKTIGYENRQQNVHWFELECLNVIKIEARKKMTLN